MSQPYYPPLTDLIPVEKIPSELGFVGNLLTGLLDNLHYRNLFYQKSASGHIGHYSFDIVFYKSVGIEMPGTNGLALLLNPTNDTSGNTAIPIVFDYQWEILKYIKEFSNANFADSARAFFDLLLNIVGTTEDQLLSECISVFINDPNPLNKFVTDFNTKNSPPTPLNLNIPTGNNAYNYILSQLTTSPNDYDVFEIIYNDYVSEGVSFNDIINRLKLLVNRWLGEITVEDAKRLLIPSFKLGVPAIRVGIQFPSNILRELDANDKPIQIPDPNNPGSLIDKPTLIMFDIASFNYSKEDGFEFDVATNLNLSIPKSEILKSGFTLLINDLKLDLSRTKNIPEAIADGRPEDFIGVYIKNGVVGFPADWFHDAANSTGELYVSNLLAGTGGLSGTIGLRAVTAGTPSPLIKCKLGNGFIISLNAFDLTFHQNAIVSSNIHGTLFIPNFKDASNTSQDVLINIDVHIGTDGEFNIVASTQQAITAIHLENVFDFHISSLFIGRQSKEAGGRFYIGLSGDIDLLLQDPIGKFLPDKVDIKKLIVYDDGKFEIEGGSIVLPKAFEIQLGPAKIGITAIHIGSYEKEGRKYKYFGFDGGVNVNPGGVDARGKGIKYYYTDDGPFDANHKFKWFIRLESLAIDIIIPGGADPKEAAVIIKGFLSIKDPKILPNTPEPLLSVLKNSTEYAGGVYVSVPKFKGLEVSAAMRLNPQVPSFIVDLGVEISTPILLGSTGLGIYGFRALFGKKYVASKDSVGLDENAEWWQYYKAKIDPDYKEGIQVSKFSIKDGFSFGAGVSLATSSDSGKTFSSKLFFMLSLPDVFLFQGQANILKDRITLDAVPDPPFFALIAITKSSVEAAFGVNYKMPDEGNIGKILTVDGVIEMGFFFGSSASWYVNVGRDTPDSRRIQARVFDLFNMYSYFMLSSAGIRAGAGVNIVFKKSFLGASAELTAFMDTAGRLSFRPKQIGGAIQLGGTVSFKFCGIGFSVWGGATLAAEAPHPKIITGEFEICVKVLKKTKCAHFQFTWTDDTSLDGSRNPVLGDVPYGSPNLNLDDAKKSVKANHIVSGEAFNLNVVEFTGTIPAPTTVVNGEAFIGDVTSDKYTLPLDSFIDIEFKKGMNVSSGTNVDKIGGISSPAEFVEFVPPQRGASDRVRHEYYLDTVEIKFFDEVSNSWKDYDFYNALAPMFPTTGVLGPVVSQTAIQNMKWGYWQQQRPGFNNKLRILATTPLSYAATMGDNITVEDLGINSNTIFCPGEPRPKTCIFFDRDTLNHVYAPNTIHFYKDVLFQITTHQGIVLNVPYNNIPYGLNIEPGDKIEIFFNEPMHCVNLMMKSGSPALTISYYSRKVIPQKETKNPLPKYEYILIKTVPVKPEELAKPIEFQAEKDNVDYVVIETKSCYEKPDQEHKITCLKPDELQNITIKELTNFLTTLIKSKPFNTSSYQLNPANVKTYAGVFMDTSLYPNKNWKETIITLTPGYSSANTLLFTIADNLGYSCNYSFELLKPVPGFSFTNIISIVDIKPYTTRATSGQNNTFLMVVWALINGKEQQVEILGKSCLPISYCYDECSTFLYEVCFCTATDYLINQTIPSATQQQANNNALFDTINKTLQPIWRPNTAFAIRLKTIDKVYSDSGSQLGVYPTDLVYGFRTAGPIGHFHNFPNSNTDQQLRTDYDALEKIAHEEEFKLKSLKHYIDYTKSYPNADGDLINAKPLFYRDVELKLFYLYNYVYEFYNDWVDYTNTPANATPAQIQYIAKSSIEVVIKDPLDAGIPDATMNYTGDPADDIINLPSQFSANNINHNYDPNNPTLLPSNINSVNNDVSILNNMLNYIANQPNQSPCVPTPPPLVPIDIATKRTLNLRPLKLYTAQFVASYNPKIAGNFSAAPFKEVAHNYGFQTSRYPNFDAQVNSYILKTDREGNVLKAAVYKLNAVTVDVVTPPPNSQIVPTIDLGMAQKVITNDITNIDPKLLQQYAEQFDRLINGVFHIDYNDLQAPETTEFNIVRHPITNKILGILIRNPEPFNDPKLPKADPNISSTEFTETLEARKLHTGIDPTLTDLGNSTARIPLTEYWGNPSEFYVIHSKDRSRIFVTNRNFNFDIASNSELKFTFKYKLYNGNTYADVSTVDVQFNLSNYSI